jgi:hypothetical protein
MNRVSLALALAAGAIAAIPNSVIGCAVAPRPGQRVETLDERALIEVSHNKSQFECLPVVRSLRDRGYSRVLQ